jgi:hypothetical protein
MRFNETDMNRLHKACKVCQEQTGSEYMWDEYEDLIRKIKCYSEEYCLKESGIHNN